MNQLVTGWVHSLYYGITIRAGHPKPRSGSRQFAKDRKIIFASIILLYLLYTIYEADWEVRLRGDFYQDLGVPHDVAVKDLQSRFRKLYAAH